MNKKESIITVETTVGFTAGKEITIGDERLLVEKVIDCNRLRVRKLDERYEYKVLQNNPHSFEKGDIWMRRPGELFFVTEVRNNQVTICRRRPIE